MCVEDVQYTDILKQTGEDFKRYTSGQVQQAEPYLTPVYGRIYFRWRLTP